MTDYYEAKKDEGKPDYTLVPTAIIEEIERVREYGCIKYDRDNWKTVPDATDRYEKAMLRHMMAIWSRGNIKEKDPESGLMHLSHIACNVAFILQLLKDETDGDDAKDKKADSKTV